MLLVMTIIAATLGFFTMDAPADAPSYDREDFPQLPGSRTAPVSRAAELALYEAIAASGLGTVEVAGTSAEGEAIHLVRMAHPEPAAAPLKVLLVGVQHGDEPAGRDGILYLLRMYLEHPVMLPHGVELWSLPTVNPDGFLAGRRRTLQDIDMNRDHAVMRAPETRLLHAMVRRIQPHLSVDCHEFRRDTRDFVERGWTEWPLIMMDAANNPMFPNELYELGVRMVNEAAPVMERAGFNYCRYFIGGAPPEAESRFSTMDVDDARNGIGAYGAVSFIIESGIYRGAENPHADIGVRTEAYLTLLRWMIEGTERHGEIRRVTEAARRAPIPAFIPVNFFWGNVGQVITPMKVVEQATGVVREIPMANFMHERIVKRSVATPRGYVISAAAARAFAELLDAHSIPWTEAVPGRMELTETFELVRIENDYDELYERYEGRQIVKSRGVAETALEAGSLVVMLDGAHATRAALLLEPGMLYGLYQWDDWRALVPEDGLMPVARLAP